MDCFYETKMDCFYETKNRRYPYLLIFEFHNSGVFPIFQSEDDMIAIAELVFYFIYFHGGSSL